MGNIVGIQDLFAESEAFKIFSLLFSLCMWASFVSLLNFTDLELMTNYAEA